MTFFCKEMTMDVVKQSSMYFLRLAFEVQRPPSQLVHLNNLQQCKHANWKRLLEETVELPTPFICLYDEEGNYTGLTNATQRLESTTCALPDYEPTPHLVDEVTGHISENDDECDILQCEQEDESENCLHGSTVTIYLPITHFFMPVNQS